MKKKKKIAAIALRILYELVKLAAGSLPDYLKSRIDKTNTDKTPENTGQEPDPPGQQPQEPAPQPQEKQN